MCTHSQSNITYSPDRETLLDLESVLFMLSSDATIQLCAATLAFHTGATRTLSATSQLWRLCFECDTVRQTAPLWFMVKLYTLHMSQPVTLTRHCVLGCGWSLCSSVSAPEEDTYFFPLKRQPSNPTWQQLLTPYVKKNSPLNIFNTRFSSCIFIRS